MSAKPRFKPRVEWVRVHPTVKAKGYSLKCRITDARDLTPEKAVQILCQWEYVTMADVGGPDENLSLGVQYAEEMAAKCGMSARVVNGKVRVRRVEK